MKSERELKTVIRFKLLSGLILLVSAIVEGMIFEPILATLSFGCMNLVFSLTLIDYVDLVVVRHENKYHKKNTPDYTSEVTYT